MKTMILCEKPSAAGKIAFALSDGKPLQKTESGVPYYIIRRDGKEIIVASAAGHLFVLDTKENTTWTYPVFSVDWHPTYLDKNSYWSKKYFDSIKKLSKGIDEYISATDYDIEGCTPYFEKILVKKGGVTRLMKMGDMVEGVFSEDATIKWKEFEYAIPSRNMLVPCMDPETLMVGFKRIKKVMRRDCDPVILRITMETGRKIHVSKNHPMFILTERGLEVKKAGSLNVGEFVPVVKELPFNESNIKDVDLIENITKRGRTKEYYVYGAGGTIKIMPKEVAEKLKVSRKTAAGWRFYDRMPLWAYMELETNVKNRKFLRIGPMKAKIKIPALIPLNRDVGRLIGYYLAEGCTDTANFIGMYFGPHENRYVDEVESIFFRIFGIRPKKRFRTGMKGTFGEGNGWEIGTKSRILNFIFNEVFDLGHNAYTKKLPDFIFSTPLEFYKNVIDAYLAGDGSLYMTRDRLVISAASKSEDLIEGIHCLLLKMGIESNMVRDRKKNNHFIIIGVKQQLRKMVSYGIDSLIPTPDIKNKLLDVGELDGKRDVFNCLPNFILTGCGVDNQTTRNMKSGHRTSVVSLIETTPFVEKILNSNLHFLKVSKIEDIPISSPYLYDIETETGSFMHGNAVITHNSVIAFNIFRFICGATNGKRMKFSTLTSPDIVEAYESASEQLDFPQIEAGLARHYMDFMWGINATRALSMALRSAGGYKTLSTGRVQGPTLKILEDRQKEIESFVSKPFWIIQLDGILNGEKITALHITGNFWDKPEAEKIFARCKGKSAAVESVEKKKYKQLPPVPFDLTTLQREAYRNFGFSPKQTLDIAQTLYELGAISYPRTASQKLPAKIGYKKIIGALKGLNQYEKLAAILLGKSMLKPREGGKTDPAHPSIFPTPDTPDIKRLNSYQLKLYDLIVKRFLSLFADPAIRESAKIVIDINGEKFVAEGVRTIEPGWMDSYSPYSRFKEAILPDAKKGDAVVVKRLEILEKKTEPPGRYSQASILQVMEKLGLGTKATRAQILQTLYDRGYIEDKSMVVTGLGSAVIGALEKYCPEIVSVELTRNFEAEMEAIMEGQKKREEVIREAEKALRKILVDFKKNEKNIGQELLKGVKIEMKKQSTVGKCNCGGDLVKRDSKGKRFIGCSSYPKCTQTFSLPHFGKLTVLSKKCAKCGLFIVSIKSVGKRMWHLCVRCGFVDSSGEKKPEKAEKKGKETVAPKTQPS